MRKKGIGSRIIFVLAAITVAFLVQFNQLGLAAAGGGDFKGVLDNYVKMGLVNNLALKQQQFSLSRSLQALKEARGMFLPSVSVEGRYSRAGGGRIIDMPIGDMVNPIHQTLNQLLAAHGIPGAYPADIPNQQIPFLRKEEHETKLRLVQPVFQPAVYYNYKIKKNLTGIEKAKVSAFKRQLTEDIKTAYYKYLKSLGIKKLLKSTRELLEENIHLSESLFRNHKVTEEVVFRSRAEMSRLEQQEAEAEKNCGLAASYFNFLLNRPLESEIQVDDATELGGNVPPYKEYRLKTLYAAALKHREEFLQLREAISAANYTVKLHGSSVLPTVNAVFDYGFQGEKYSFTGKDDYWMGSLVFSWNLYRGGQDLAKRKQALYQKKQLETRRAELENQMRLEIFDAYQSYVVAQKNVASTADALRASKETLSIVTRKYREGMVPQIEYLEARNDYTSSGIKHIIAIYDVYIKEARLERVSPEKEGSRETE
jgi:outer membrane protein